MLRENESKDKLLETAGKEYEFVSYKDDMYGLHPEDFSIIMQWCKKEWSYLICIAKMKLNI